MAIFTYFNPTSEEKEFIDKCCEKYPKCWTYLDPSICPCPLAKCCIFQEDRKEDESMDEYGKRFEETLLLGVRFLLNNKKDHINN